MDSGYEPHMNMRKGLFPKFLRPEPCNQWFLKVVLGGKDMQLEDIQEYMEYIMKDKCCARITDIKHHGVKTECVMQFADVASTDKYLTKLKEMEKRTNVIGQKYIPNAIEEYKRICRPLAVNIKLEHERKLQDVEENMSIKSKQKTNVNDIDKLLAEQKALRSKRDELQSQLVEFNAFDETFEKLHRSSTSTSHNVRFNIEVSRLKSALPMYAKRTEIVEMVTNNQVSILLGETGSGKSTQVTQYLFEAGMTSKGSIVCTQPRKVAATSLANRVSQEMHSRLGDVVGFKVGMSRQSSKDTAILYMTDHMLLKECLQDPLLSKYSCIIIDEAHERSLNTDLLLGMIKKALPLRSELKVVITSATIDPDIFVKYFDGCPVLKVSGRVFPVEVIYSAQTLTPDDDYELHAAQKAVEVADQRHEGDVLVFLTTPWETERACEITKKIAKHPAKLICLALHGKTQAEDQKKVFSETPVGCCKIVFATNSAETSITIPGIKVVIDTGLVKEKLYDATKNLCSLKVTKVSKSSANQRKGRAGRMANGTCYRLYTEDDYELMDDSSKPEILRVHLGMAMLTLISLSIDPREFDFVEMPSKAAIQEAYKTLEYLGAVVDGKLTSLGTQMAGLSLEPRTAKLVLMGLEQGIGYEAVLVASFSAIGGNIFFRAGTDQEKLEADRSKVKFCNKHGDIHTMLDVYTAWDRIDKKDKNKWCAKNSINAKSMRLVQESAKEILNAIKHELRLVVPQKYCKDVFSMQESLSALIVDCYFQNLCIFSGNDGIGYILAEGEQRCFHIHPSSSLKVFGSSSTFLVYENTLTTSRDFLINVTCLTEEAVKVVLAKRNQMFKLDIYKSLTVSPCVIKNVGKTILGKIQGPRHSRKITIEQDLHKLLKTTVLSLDVNCAANMLTLFVGITHHAEAETMLQGIIESERARLRQEDKEFYLADKNPTRIVIGSGGRTHKVLFPDEFRCVHITCIPQDLTEETLVEYCLEYGTVLHSEKFTYKKGPRQLMIIFEEPTSAKKLLNDLNKGDLTGVMGKRKDTSRANDEVKVNNDVTIKIKWSRRPITGVAFANFIAPIADSVDEADQQEITAINYASRALSHSSSIRIGGKFCRIYLSKKKDNELFIGDIPKDKHPEFVQKGIQEELSRLTALDPENVGTFLMRDACQRETTEEERVLLQDQIREQIHQALPSLSDYRVNVLMPKTNKTMDYIGFVTLMNPSFVQEFSDKMQDMQINGQSVLLTMNLKVSIYAKQKTYIFIQDCLNEEIQLLQEKVDVKVWQLRNGTFCIGIQAQCFEDLIQAQDAITKITNGHKIELDDKRYIQHFRLDTGKQFLQGVSTSCSVLIEDLNRGSTLVIYGKRLDAEKAASEIEMQIVKISQLKTGVFQLKEQYSPGMMKLAMQVYGTDLKKMQIQSGVSMIDLNLRHHLLTVQGSDQAVENIAELLDTLQKQLSKKQKVRSTTSEVLPDCPVCFCEIALDEIYCLEYCGHVYCNSCLKAMLAHAVQDKSFPIVCASEGCGKDVVLRDLESFFNIRDAVVASLDDYVAMNSETMRYCITPDCPSVYRVTTNGQVVNCCVCFALICSTCHVPRHHGLTCEQYGNFKGLDEKDKENTAIWLQEDKNNRSLCPKCKYGIEKNGGCMRVICLKCNAHICWRCKKYFDDSGATYDHLSKECGGIF